MSVRLAVAVAVLGGTGLSGMSSGGDPYFPLDGNQGYDVRHYRVVNTYRPETDRLVGTTVLQARATEELKRFSLDLVLPVDRVLVDGRPAEFDKPRRHELHVTPAQPVRTGHSFTVEVRYHGRPSALEAVGVTPGRDLYFHTPGETIAMGEPQNGAWWFAANETPQDKATFDITIRVPRGTEAVSNGALVSRDVVRGWTRWHWRLEEPVATYLAFFAAGDFRIERTSAEDGVAGRPSVLAVSRALPADDQRAALRRLRRTDDAVAWLESVLGSYPYGQTGGVITAIPAGYALETATRPVYPWAWSQGGGWRGLLVHEQAHQWFGNDVTVRRWRDVWLNEGFATYAEWWYAEDHGGRTVAERLSRTYDAIPADRPFWEVQVGDPGPARMWSDAVYLRGAMTLAALRNRIGDADFATVVTEWLDRHSGGHGTGEEFRALAEEVSGEDLGGFFAHWLDDTVKPEASPENGLG